MTTTLTHIVRTQILHTVGSHWEVQYGGSAENGYWIKLIDHGLDPRLYTSTSEASQHAVLALRSGPGGQGGPGCYFYAHTLDKGVWSPVRVRIWDMANLWRRYGAQNDHARVLESLDKEFGPHGNRHRAGVDDLSR